MYRFAEMIQASNIPAQWGMHLTDNLRRDIPYPAEGSVSVLKTDIDPTKIERLEYTLKDTYSIHLQQQCIVSSLSPGLVRPLVKGHEIIAEIVHTADSILKSALHTSTSWAPILAETAAEDVCGGSGMYVMIDKLISVHTQQSFHNNGQDIILHFDLPRVRRMNRWRYVYVRTIRVCHQENGYRSNVRLDIILSDDRVTVRHEIPPVTVRLRQGFIQPDTAPGIPQVAISFSTANPSERLALETLREQITEDDWRNYLKRGFLSVRGKSGRVYQVFPNKWHTVIWEKGKRVAVVCSRLSANVPPTDNVIAFKAIIEADEALFEKSGNVYRMIPVTAP